MNEDAFRSRVVDVGGGFVGHNQAVPELLRRVGEEEVVAATTATLIGRQSLVICTPSRLLVANSKPKMIGHRLESVQELPLVDLGLVSVEGRNFMAGTESDQASERDSSPTGSGYRCSRVPGWMRLASMKAPMSSPLSRMTRPKR